MKWIRTSYTEKEVEREIHLFFNGCKHNMAKRKYTERELLVWSECCSLGEIGVLQFLTSHEYICIKSFLQNNALKIQLMIKLYLSCMLFQLLWKNRGKWYVLKIDEERFITEWCYIFLYTEEEWEDILAIALTYEPGKARIEYIYYLMLKLGNINFLKQIEEKRLLSEKKHCFSQYIEDMINKVLQVVTV